MACPTVPRVPMSPGLPYNKGLLSSILWELCSAQATPDDGRRTMDARRRTMDAGPSTPYYKLTGELKNAEKK